MIVMYQTILFDLDGTLTDSSQGITNSAAYALEKMGFERPSKQDLLPFIGPPLQESFKQFYHLSEKESQQAVTFYREYFAEKGIFENILYPEVSETLLRLKENGKQLLLATSKPEHFARIILNHFQLTDYFTEIAGASLDGKLGAKGDVIALALQRIGITDTSTCLMVGDRKHDILGAKANQMDSAGVLYGFGSREELSQAGATFIIDRLADIHRVKKD